LFNELEDIENGDHPPKETNKNDPILCFDDEEDMLKTTWLLLYYVDYLFEFWLFELMVCTPDAQDYLTFIVLLWLFVLAVCTLDDVQDYMSNNSELDQTRQVEYI